MIDLGAGHPDPALLALAEVREASAACLNAAPSTLLQYTQRQGDPRFRARLATWLRTTGLGVDPADQLVVTAGASHAVDLVARQLASPGDTVLVEEPTYFLALDILVGRGLRVVPVPCDDHGLRPDALAEALDAHRPAFVYTIPTFHNPTGATLPLERRHDLVAQTRRTGTLVVADEVYPLLHFGGPPPPALRALGAAPHVVSIGSFSKLLGPGLRLGWIAADADMVRRLTACPLLASGGSINPVTAAVVGELLARDLWQRPVEVARQTYAARAAALADALHHEAPSLRFAAPEGGFFVWARLPDGADAEALRPRARAAGVDFRPGGRFTPSRRCDDRIRLSFTLFEPEVLREGVRRLASVIG